MAEADFAGSGGVTRGPRAGGLKRTAFFFGTALLAAAWSNTASAETRTWVMSWLTPATYSQEGDCPNGLSQDVAVYWKRDLLQAGHAEADIDKMIEGIGIGGAAEVPGMQAVSNRGRIAGKPVNIYANPATASDPQLPLLDSRYAYGFDLDGKGPGSPGSFQDPETGEQGIDNQLFRALGCNTQFRGTLQTKPAVFAWLWDMTKRSMPAWIISISGDDLSKDGPVTIMFSRATTHTSLMFDGTTRPYVSFRLDTDPRSQNKLRGVMTNQVVTLAEPAKEFSMLMDQIVYPVFALRDARMRLKLEPDGNLKGIMGGYHPWKPVYLALAQAGYSTEHSVGLHLPGIYYALKKSADAYPDEKGVNTAISAAYQIEGVPAFISPEEPRISQAH